MKYYKKMKLVKGKNNKNPPKPMTKKKLAKYITVTFLFLALVGVTVYEKYIFFDDEEPDISNVTKLLPPRKPYIESYDTSKCIFEKNNDQPPCSVTCKNIYLPDDVEEIYSRLEEAKAEKMEACSLSLSLVNFENKSINKNWLKISNDTQPKITKLEIINSNLRFIGPESFSNFLYLEKICLGLVDLTHLSKKAFLGLPNMKEFAIWEMYNLTSISYAFLSNFPNLETLQVTSNESSSSYSNIQGFVNLTGNYTARKILSVDFRSNSLVNITKDMLNGYPNAQQIYLERSGIQNFENGSLEKITGVRTFDISNNRIAKLPENVFKKFFEKNKALNKVMVSDNKLQCDCEMKWLQDYINKNGGHLVQDFENARCQNFPENVKFLEADMCPNNGLHPIMPILNGTTTPEISTTTTTESISSTKFSTADKTSSTAPTTPNDDNVTYPDGPPTEDGNDNTTYPDGSPTDSPTEGDGNDDENPPVNITCKPQNKIAKSRIIRSASYPYIRIHLPLPKTNEDDLMFTLAPKQQYFNISDYDGTTINVTFNNKNNQNGKSILWLTYEDSNALQFKKEKNSVATSCSTNISKKWYLIQNLEPQKSYLICVFDDIKFNVNLLDCVPHTTQPLAANQAWLTFGSKPIAIVIVVVVSIGAFVVGSGILYVLVRKNPTLIKGSKKVIVVKRQDKQQIMIMPNGYKNFKNISNESSDVSNSDNCSVVSYISAIQPSPMELLAYRLERLREKIQEESNGKINNLSVPISSNSESFSSPRASIKTIISTDTIYENDFEQY